MKHTDLLSHEEIRWLRRAGSVVLLFMPVDIRERIIERGLGERNLVGTFNLTPQGKRALLWSTPQITAR